MKNARLTDGLVVHHLHKQSSEANEPVYYRWESWSKTLICAHSNAIKTTSSHLFFFVFSPRDLFYLVRDWRSMYISHKSTTCLFSFSFFFLSSVSCNFAFKCAFIFRMHTDSIGYLPLEFGVNNVKSTRDEHGKWLLNSCIKFNLWFLPFFPFWVMSDAQFQNLFAAVYFLVLL